MAVLPEEEIIVKPEIGFGLALKASYSQGV